MADVVLTHGYFLEDDLKEREIMKPYPPLGLLYVSAYLRKLDYDVAVFDSTFASVDDLHSLLASKQAPVLGVYVNLTTRRRVVQMIATAKSFGWTVVVGGPEPGNYPAEYLRCGADVVVVGEGEVTMHEVLQRLSLGGTEQLKGVEGTVIQNDDGTILVNPPRTTLLPIDSLPWPDRAQIDIQRYVDVWREHHGQGSVNLITARGCAYKCRWCSHAVFGHTHRRRKVTDCADELEFLRDTYHPDQVWYADDVFTIHHRWLYNYAAELKRRDLRLPFETISRADRMMDERVLETLAEMGCWRIWIGSESGSQRILDAMERGVTVEQVQWAAKAAQRHGIQVGMFLMWGYEGETLDDIEATVEHVKKTNPDVFLTTVSYPIKGTKYFEAVRERLVAPADWEMSTDRDYDVSGRPDREYYRHADEWLRNAVAAARSEPNSQPAAELEVRARQARAAMASLTRP